MLRLRPPGGAERSELPPVPGVDPVVRERLMMMMLSAVAVFII
jgi:hypothetical protein